MIKGCFMRTLLRVLSHSLLAVCVFSLHGFSLQCGADAYRTQTQRSFWLHNTMGLDHTAFLSHEINMRLCGTTHSTHYLAQLPQKKSKPQKSQPCTCAHYQARVHTTKHVLHYEHEAAVVQIWAHKSHVPDPLLMQSLYHIATHPTPGGHEQPEGRARVCLYGCT